MKYTKNYFRTIEGFTMIEIIMVIIILGIIAAVAAPRVTNMISQSYISATQEEMMMLRETIIGNPDMRVGGEIADKGYRGDTGQSPTSWNDLIIKPTGMSAWNPFTQSGWNGPYVLDDGTGNYKIDAWGQVYGLTDSTIISFGPDKTQGTSDDIILVY